MKRNGERVYLTAEEAMSALPEGDNVHTFKGRMPMIIGADVSRERAEELLTSAKRIEVSGPVTMRMNHGLTVWWENDGMAMETDADKINALNQEGLEMEEEKE